jgi:predicted amidohydrolase
MATFFRAAALQIPNYSGKQAAIKSLEAAAPLLKKAAADGASFVLLPEAFTGYSYEGELGWPYAEGFSEGESVDSVKAPATAALSSLAKELKTNIGFTLLERRGAEADILNTFVMAHGGTGRISKHHHKSEPAAFENFIFASQRMVPNTRPRVFTLTGESLGVDAKEVRFGVSICYENYLEPTWHELAEQNPDVILAPHCGMLPSDRSWATKASVADFRRVLSSNAIAGVLGVPMIHSNKVGPFSSKVPFFPYTMFDAAKVFFDGSYFPGNSRIVDASGKVLHAASAGKEAQSGYAIADIPLPTLSRRGATHITSPRRLRMSGPLSRNDLVMLREHQAYPESAKLTDLWNIPLGERAYRKNQALRAKSAYQ